MTKHEAEFLTCTYECMKDHKKTDLQISNAIALMLRIVCEVRKVECSLL